MKIPNTIKKIGSDAFSYCTSLKNIEIPDSVIEIGSGAFRGCKSLVNINLPDIRYIGENFFEDCISLQEIKIPTTVTEIGAYAFSGCTLLETLTIPDTVTKIGVNAFLEVKQVTYNGFRISEEKWGAKEILSTNDESLSDFTEVTLDENILKILGYKISESETCLDDLYGGKIITDKYLKKNGSNIYFFDIPSIYSHNGKNYKITGIADYLFLHFNLSEITIPNTVTKIGDGAFSGCKSSLFGNKSLNKLTVPDIVTEIGDGAFDGIDVVYYNGILKNSTWGATKVINSNNDYIEVSFNDRILKELGYKVKCEEELIKYRGRFYHKYIRKNKKDVTSLEIPAIYTYKKKEYKIVEIADGAFADCELLENIKLPETITRIGNGAFRNCNSLKNINISNEVKRIGEGAFYGCHSLEYIIIKDSINCTNSEETTYKNVMSIDKEAFQYCKALKNITFKNVFVNIDKEAFCRCESLESVKIFDSVVNIGNSAFSGCESLTNIEISNSSLCIYPFAFCGCDKLKEIIKNGKKITIPNGFSIVDEITFILVRNAREAEDTKEIILPDTIKEIPNNAFEGCSSLENIVIPNGVTTIAEDTFRECESLEQVILPNSVISIAESAFMSCKSLKNITLPKSLISIGAIAFWKCESLESVIIPEGVKNIEESAFDDCSSLKTVTIPESIVHIDSRAFWGCESLKQVKIPLSLKENKDIDIERLFGDSVEIEYY